MHTFNELLKQKLVQREQQGLLRTLKVNSEALIDFSSNDYLGLARSNNLADLINAESKKHKLKNGSTGSRLLTGNDEYVERTEDYLAGIFKGESALVFNSGYSANLSVLSSIPTKNDTIIFDELAHACIKDGARLSLAKHFSFKHNDCNDLELKIKKASGNIFIVVESIYSMDGDTTPLQEIVQIAERSNSVIIIDEAHSTGVMGENGNGLTVSLGLQDKVAIRIYTFGKAMGVHGACVVGSRNLKQYLVNFARPFIYTTALSPHSVASIYCAFQFLSENMELQKRLKTNIDHFLAKTNSITNRTFSKSAIQNLIFPGNAEVKSISQRIIKEGIDVRPILSPTVKAGSERLRICLHAFNTPDEIDKLVNLIQI